MSDWQPIGTAPKDGTWIIVFGTPYKFGGSGIALGRWEATEYDKMEVVERHFNDAGNVIQEKSDLVKRANGFWDGQVNPTHWMPLPDPPAALK